MKTLRLIAVSVVLLVTAWLSASAEKVPVNNSKSGVYRALADLIFQSYQKGDLDTAGTLGRVLDRTWDTIEENGDHGINKANPKLFEEIDEAMDAFIKPVIHADQKAPDPAAVAAAYHAYVAELQKAD